jgi:hypothetical protein
MHLKVMRYIHTRQSNMFHFDIYLISAEDADGNTLRYYGSTENIIKREEQHRRDYERWVKAGRPDKKERRACSSLYVMDYDWTMEKIDSIEDEDEQNGKERARKLEGKYQKENECVNVNIAGRTWSEWYNDSPEQQQKSKEYRQKNFEKNKAYQQDYYNENTKTILEKNKVYRKQNKEKIAQKDKEKYEKNKDVISKENAKRVTCECGEDVRKGDISRHRNTLKHITQLNLLLTSPIS